MGTSNTTSAFARAFPCAVLLTLVAVTSACATAGRRQTDFEDAQLKYTQSVRWAEFEAAEEYVVPEKRKAFQEVAQSLGGVRFIDYRLQSLEFDPATNQATAKVIYSAYKRAAPTAISVEEEQIWQRDEETKAWIVSSTFVEKDFESERRY